MIIRFLKQQDFSNLMLLIRQGFPNRTLIEESSREKEILEILAGKTSEKFIGVCDENDSIFSALEIYDFEICFREKVFKFGGLGRVVTGLVDKKQGFARELIKYAFSYFQKNDYLFCGLFPFNIEYYRKMGFGYGAENYVFSIRPNTFVNGEITGLRNLSKDDLNSLDNYYESYAKNCHGMLRNHRLDTQRFSDCTGIIVHESNGKIDGYLCYEIEKSWFDGAYSRDLVISEFIVSSKEAQLSFSSFFFAQQDQFNRVRLHVQDPWIYFLSNDSDSGENKAYSNGIQEYGHYCGGIVYRIIDEKEYIQRALSVDNKIDFEFTLLLELFDNRDESEKVQYFVRISPHELSVIDSRVKADCFLSMSKADFASWSFGVVSLTELIKTLRADLNLLEYEDVLQKIFGYKNKPKCVSYF